MARNQRSKNANNSYRPNFWGFMQNVLIAALNKGQLLGMGIIVFFLILAIKLPSDDIVPLFEKLLDISEINSILGWILAGITTFGGFLVNRWQRRIHTNEVRRISNEKKLLQQKLTDKKLPSSNNKK
jgi:hypothetical protein